MVRKSVRYFILIVPFLILIFLYNRSCNVSIKKSRKEEISEKESGEEKLSASSRSPSEGLEEVACFLNREVAKNVGAKQKRKSIACKTDGEEVYVPFTFLQKYYEVWNQSWPKQT